MENYEGFVGLNNKITNIVEELFSQGAAQTGGAKRKLFFIIDNEEGKLKVLYERLKVRCAVYANMYEIYYTDNLDTASYYDKLLNLYKGKEKELVTIITNHDTEIKNFIDALYRRLADIRVLNAGLSISQIARLAIFRLFDYKTNEDKRKPKEKEKLFKESSVKLAEVLSEKFNIKNPQGKLVPNPDGMLDTSVINKFVSNANEIEIIEFADEIFALTEDETNITLNPVFSPGNMDAGKNHRYVESFTDENHPWFLYEIVEAYIPEYIVMYSLEHKLKKTIQTDKIKDDFDNMRSTIAADARMKLMQKWEISSFEAAEEELSEFIEYQPILSSAKEFEDKRKTVTRKKKQSFFSRLFGEPDTETIEVLDYEETPINEDISELSEQFIDYFKEKVSIKEFYRIIFSSLTFHQQNQNEAAVKNSLKPIIGCIVDDVFTDKSPDYEPSNLLIKVKQYYKDNLSDDILTENCHEISENASGVLNNFTERIRKYGTYIQGLTKDNMPGPIDMDDLYIHNLNDSQSIYKCFIDYIDNNPDFNKSLKEKFEDAAKEASISPPTLVTFPLAPSVNADSAKDMFDADMTDFEKGVKRQRKIFRVMIMGLDKLELST